MARSSVSHPVEVPVIAWFDHVWVLDPVHVGVSSESLSLWQDNEVLKEFFVFNDIAVMVGSILVPCDLISESVVSMDSDGFPPSNMSWGFETNLHSSISTSVACVSLSVDSDLITVLQSLLIVVSSVPVEVEHMFVWLVWSSDFPDHFANVFYDIVTQFCSLDSSLSFTS